MISAYCGLGCMWWETDEPAAVGQVVDAITARVEGKDK
jgi:hypothetical protein